jgi:hypothetical protein
VDGQEVPLLNPNEGTLEFWYRPQFDPNWVEHDYYEVPILTNGTFRVSYFGEPHGRGHFYAGVSHQDYYAVGMRPTRLAPGRWYHLAVCWFPWQGKMAVLFYVDGVLGPPPLLLRTDAFGVYAAKPNLKELPQVTLGGKFDMTIDDLRIADHARYRQLSKISEYQFTVASFPLPTEPQPADEDTLALFRFDDRTDEISSRAGVGRIIGEVH